MQQGIRLPPLTEADTEVNVVLLTYFNNLAAEREDLEDHLLHATWTATSMTRRLVIEGLRDNMF